MAKKKVEKFFMGLHKLCKRCGVAYLEAKSGNYGLPIVVVGFEKGVERFYEAREDYSMFYDLEGVEEGEDKPRLVFVRRTVSEKTEIV